MNAPFSVPISVSGRRGISRFALLLALTFGLAASVRADITLNFVPHDGDKVSDIYKVQVKAESPDGIDKVEFLVDGQSRTTKGGTPYFFNWDTIADTEGEHQITAIAYDGNGATKKASLKLVIENEIGTGAPALAQKALDALPKKDFDTALKYARRSLKAEPNNVDGSRALAAVYASRQDWDRANDALDKAKGVDSSAAALNELADYKMQRAIQRENIVNFVGDYTATSELRRKSSDLLLKDLHAKAAAAAPGADAIAANEAVGDALLNAGRYLEAVTEYNKNLAGDAPPISSMNRMVLAYALADQFGEAEGAARNAIRAKKDDAVTRAVYGMAYLRHRQFTEARAITQKDLAAKTPASLIIAAYADAALGEHKRAVDEAKQALELLPNSPEAHYAMALASNDLQVNERELRKTVALETFYSGPYLMYAANMALSQRADRYDQATGVVDAVLKLEPDNVFAQTMQALLFLQQGQLKNAGTTLNVLSRHEQNSPDVMTAVAVYWNQSKNGPQSINALQAARRLDVDRFAYTEAPLPMELLEQINRKLHYRAGYFLTPAVLYPSKMETPAPGLTPALPAAP